MKLDRGIWQERGKFRGIMKQIKEDSRFVRYKGYQTYIAERYRKLKKEKGVCK
jgi:hypothetical protein